MLLLYLNRDPVDQIGNISTFHYASTLSNTRTCEKCCCDSSTFHYASTLSMEQAYFFRHNTNLHSIMLLLYLVQQMCSSHHSTIYIPLCFYFIGSRSRYYCTDLHLHSIMLLLYLSNGSKASQTLKNLHSIMLLLYLARFYNIPVIFHYLHSIMLLLYPS